MGMAGPPSSRVRGKWQRQTWDLDFGSETNFNTELRHPTGACEYNVRRFLSSGEPREEACICAARYGCCLR